MARRAIGGPVSAGVPYMVGERGPEMFVPGSSGTVIPNNRLGGGAAVINHITIQTGANPNDVVRALQNYAQQNGEPAPTTVPGSPEPVYVVEDTPRLAQTAIGQNDVRATPLQMAMVAGAVANVGTIVAPSSRARSSTRVTISKSVSVP